MSVWNYSPLSYTINTDDPALLHIADNPTLMSMVYNAGSGILVANTSVPGYGPTIVINSVPTHAVKFTGVFTTTLSFVISSPIVFLGAVRIGIALIDSTAPPHVST